MRLEKLLASSKAKMSGKAVPNLLTPDDHQLLESIPILELIGQNLDTCQSLLCRYASDTDSPDHEVVRAADHVDCVQSLIGNALARAYAMKREAEEGLSRCAGSTR